MFWGCPFKIPISAISQEQVVITVTSRRTDQIVELSQTGSSLQQGQFYSFALIAFLPIGSILLRVFLEYKLVTRRIRLVAGHLHLQNQFLFDRMWLQSHSLSKMNAFILEQRLMFEQNQQRALVWSSCSLSSGLKPKIQLNGRWEGNEAIR